MWPKLKTQANTVRVYRNGYEFQIDPDNPFIRFKGGSSPKVTQSSTLIPSQKDFVTNVLEGMVQPQVGEGFEGFQGQRLAEVDPFFTGAAQGGVQNLMGDMNQVFDPIRQQAESMFTNTVTPEVMERFAAFGGAGGGGAAQALSRAGGEASTALGAQLAPLWMQSQMALPGLAQQAGGFEQQARQQPLDIEMQRFTEQQPYANPYLALGQSLIPGSGQFAENIASPGQQDFLSSAAPGIGAGLTAAMFLSDERAKENIKPIPNALEKLAELDGKTFKFKGIDEPRAGLVAQDVEKVFSQGVVEINGMKHIRIDAVIGLIVSAVNELAARKAG